VGINTSILFTPLTVRGIVFRNRLVMPPMVTLRGITTPEGVQWKPFAPSVPRAC
jgi:2,4-dienoyl-CoA reductase-like NADH-dependent reductase (Old Yellow Enzyme family)